MLLDPTDMSFDMLVSPRGRFAYDADTHRMTLTFKSVRIDEGLLASVYVSPNDPYIESARIERYAEGVRIVLHLKPAAEVYTFRHYSFERAIRAAPEQSQIACIELASRDAAEKADGYYILDEITYICTEEEAK